MSEKDPLLIRLWQCNDAMSHVMDVITDREFDKQRLATIRQEINRVYQLAETVRDISEGHFAEQPKPEYLT